MIHLAQHTFEDFSRGLLALDRLVARGVSPSTLMREGLSLMRTLVPFDAAWWGECSGGIDGMAPNNWLSGSINLSADFAREWNHICASDRVAHASMQGLDTVISSVGHADPEPAVEAFSRRHDLHEMMAVTRALPGSGLLQFVSLYLHSGSPAFEPLHRVLFDQFSAHLMQRWSALVAQIIGQGVEVGDAHGLVDASGDFVYVDARLALLLRQRFPHWHGTRLPDGLARRVPEAPGTLQIGGRRLGTQRCGELVLLSLTPQRRGAPLPPREMHVARLYADGRSHKDIARDTGLAPATVRTYLRHAYLRLGVSDKMALGRALAGRGPRKPTLTPG